MDTSKLKNIVIDNIDYKDSPRFCDAYISSAELNGVPLNEYQLEELNEDADFVYLCVRIEVFG